MIALVLLLQGCRVGENHFWKERADIWCDKKKKCDGEGFDNEFDGKGDCKDEKLKEWDADRSSLEECEYDAAAAAACLDGQRGQNCEEIAEGQVIEGCNEVYSCLDAD
jgi:hypothetical protein